MHIRNKPQGVLCEKSTGHTHNFRHLPIVKPDNLYVNEMTTLQTVHSVHPPFLLSQKAHLLFISQNDRHTKTCRTLGNNSHQYMEV
jgi:hypothetical protein